METMMAPRTWYTATQFADALGVSRETFYRWLETGKIKRSDERDAEGNVIPMWNHLYVEKMCDKHGKRR